MQKTYVVGRHTCVYAGFCEHAQYLELYIVHDLVLTQRTTSSSCSLDGSLKTISQSLVCRSQVCGP